MSGLLRSIGPDGDEGRIPRTAVEKNCTSPETTDRKHVFGTPTSQLSSNTDISSRKTTVDNKPRVSDVGMSPVRDSVGKLVHPRNDGVQYSEDNVILHPGGSPVQSDEQDVSPQREEGKREGRWGSARARLGSVFSGRHSIRESVSRIRRGSVDPTHLMNDLCSDSGSRADLGPPSTHGSGRQSLRSRDVAATSTENTFPGHFKQASETPGGASPSRLSSKFTSWKRHNLSMPKGRGREPSQEDERTADSVASEQLRSSSTPPPQKFKVRVNRFLRSGRRSVSSTTGSTASGDTAPAPSTGRGRPGPLASASNTQTPPYPSSAESSTARGMSRPGTGFRQAVRRGVSSARRRMSAPFLSTPPLSDDNVSVSDAPAIEPPERPQTVPLEQRSGISRTPGGSQFELSDEPGRAFLPSEARNVIPPTTPPIVTENPHAEDWLGGDFEHISMIQSRPPLSPPGMEESPPLSPWAKTPNEPQPWVKLTETPPRLPKIASVAPFVIGELMARDLTTAKASSGGQRLSDKYWAVASGSKGKGKERAKSDASDYLIPPPRDNFYLESSGKSIEVLDEEKRRRSRDTGIMGLGPEVILSSDPFERRISGAKGGEFTYAAAVREIAGLGRYPKRPPPDTGTDDVSVPMPECDYDLPLPNFRFSILSEPSSSSNEPDVSPCAASSSLAQETSGSISYLVRLAPTQTRISTTTTTTRTATAASTNPSTSITSPSDYTPYNYQMLLSSKRPYLFVLQELSSGTYIKITPQKNSSPVSRSLSTLTLSYPETPAPSQTSPSDARSPVSVRFVSSNGLLIYDAEKYEETDDDDEEEGKNGKME